VVPHYTYSAFALGSYLTGSDIGCVLSELEAQNPYTRSGLSIHLCRFERPLLCRIESQLGEIPARSRRLEGGRRDVAAFIDCDPYGYLDLSMDGMTCKWRDVGQNSTYDCTLRRCTLRRLSSRYQSSVVELRLPLAEGILRQ
jgi:hypothetical protein